MASWYDYLPVVGSVVEAAKGNGKQALIDAAGPIGPAIQTGYNKYAGAIDEQKQGDLTAAAQAKALGQQIFDESMGGLDKAEGYYGPATAALKNIYGAPGSMTGGPGAYPLAPGPGK